MIVLIYDNKGNKVKRLTILLLSLFLLTACTQKKEEVVMEEVKKEDYYFSSVVDIYDDYIPMLNTVCKLTYVDKEYDKKLIADIEEIMIKYHKLLDNYHYYRDENDDLIKNIKYINDYYGKGPIEVSDEMIDILINVKEMMTLTRGYFNPFMGTLIDDYSPMFSNFPLVRDDINKEIIDNYLGNTVDYRDIDEIIQIDGNVVSFNIYKDIDILSINLGAFSKGYVGDRVLDYLKGCDNNLLLNEGTSSIICHGNDEDIFTVGVRNPKNRYSYLFALELMNDYSISTSGSDQNYYLLDDNTIRCHIINPYSGYSENFYCLVNVICENAMIGDCLSTALFNIEDIELIKDIIVDVENAYNTDIDIVLVSTYDEEFLIKTSFDKNKLLNKNNCILSTEMIN